MVTVRTMATPATFTLRQRVKPFRPPVRLYLVPNGLAPDVHSRFDTRAHFVGSIVTDVRWRGLLRFIVPPLDSGSYTIGYWSRGWRFVVLHITEQNVAPRYRPLMLLEVMAPTEPCPVTIPRGSAPPGLRQTGNYFGNGALWATLPSDGVFSFGREHVRPDGSVGTKLIWFAAGVTGALVAEVRRLGEDTPVQRGAAILGRMDGFRGSATWATRTAFPGEGCWKVTGRVKDIAFSFVVKVVVAPTD